MIELVADECTVTVPASSLGAVGPGTTVVSISQIGDWGTSRPAKCTIYIGEGSYR